MQTPVTIDLPVTAEDRRVAMLAAVAIGLSLAEAVIPSPLPGVKPGLANIVVLIVLLQHGLRTAIWVSALRVLAGSLLLGSFLSPGFWLAVAGASMSLAILSIVRFLPRRVFGPVTLSVLAAFGHIGGQLALAWGWLLPSASIGYLLPVFAGAALLFGAVNGVIVARLLKTGTLADEAEDRRQSPSCIPPSP